MSDSRLPFALPLRQRADVVARHWVESIASTEPRLTFFNAILQMRTRLQAAAVDEALPHDAPSVWIALHMADRERRAVLQLAERAAWILSTRALGLERPLRGPMSPVEFGGLLFALDRLGADVQHGLGHSAHLAGPLCDEDQARQFLRTPNIVRLGFCLELDGERCLLNLHLAGPLPEPPRPTQGALPSWLSTCPVRLSLDIGSSTVKASELEDLAPGDLVTLDSLCHPDRRLTGSTACLRAGRFCWNAQWLGPFELQLTSCASHPFAEDPMHERQPEAREPRNYDLVDSRGNADSVSADLPVDIHVECGKLELTVAEASALRPGDVLRLRRQVSADMSLTAGGRTIGRGRLVEFEGELAVELLEVAR